MVRVDTIYGIDRYESSQYFGQLVVERANIWKTPSANNKVGEIQHAAAVEVLDQRDKGGASWHRVKGRDWNGNMITGWCRTSLLKINGESEFKCHA